MMGTLDRSSAGKRSKRLANALGERVQRRWLAMPGARDFDHRRPISERCPYRIDRRW